MKCSVDCRGSWHSVISFKRWDWNSKRQGYWLYERIIPFHTLMYIWRYSSSI